MQKVATLCRALNLAISLRTSGRSIHPNRRDASHTNGQSTQFDAIMALFLRQTPLRLDRVGKLRDLSQEQWLRPRPSQYRFD